MIQPLRDLAEVRAGHPFRGSVPVVNDGNAQVIQMRDIAHDGSVSWGTLARTRIAPHNTFRGPDWQASADEKMEISQTTLTDPVPVLAAIASASEGAVSGPVAISVTGSFALVSAV